MICPAKLQLKARILLHADTGKMGARVRQQWTQDWIDAVVSRKQRVTPPVPRIFDGAKEARLIALTCSPPPAGHGGWTLRPLEHKEVDERVLKTRLSRASSSNG